MQVSQHAQYQEAGAAFINVVNYTLFSSSNDINQNVGREKCFLYRGIALIVLGAPDEF